MRERNGHDGIYSGLIQNRVASSTCCSWRQGALMIILSIVDFIKKCRWTGKGEGGKWWGRVPALHVSQENLIEPAIVVLVCFLNVFFKFEHFETRPWNMMELGFQPSAGGRESAEVWWSGSGCPIAPPWAMVVSTVFSGPRTGNGPSRRPKPMILGPYAVRDGPLGQLLFQANHAEGTRGESKKHM